MARAKIQINGIDATAATVAIGSTVLLSNDDEGGELTYAWAFIDQPEGTADTLSNAAIENPSFTPTKEGTYELRLVVNANLGSQAIQTATVAVLDGRTGQRIPAAGETVEGGLRGWAEAVNRILAATLHDSADGNVQVAQTPGGISVGTIVYFTGLATINPTMQFPFEVMQVAVASISPQPYRLGIVLDGVIAGDLGAGKLVKVRTFGIVPFAASGSPAVGDDVYLGNTGLPQLTAGASGRTVGKVLSSSAGSYRWLFATTLVGTSGIADSSVTSAKIADGTIATADLADGAVTSAKIADGTIATGDLADGSVTSAKIADGTIVAGDIADGTITAVKLATAANAGRYLGRQVLTASSGTYTPTSGTSTIVVTMVGGGGGGGGAAGGAGTTAAGSGGNSGVLIRKRITGITGGGAFACGAAGTAGANTGGNGGDGGDTTLSLNAGAITLTAKAGAGGQGCAAGTPSFKVPRAYISGSTAADSMEFNYGLPGINSASNYNYGGSGGWTSLGPGGLTTASTAGLAPVIGFGGGGSGGSASTTGAVGGIGAAGCIIVDEYT